jgi:putative methyltransferase (TIGR04325 family)
MSLKSWLRRILPPLVVDTIRKRRIEAGEFQTWAAAVAESPSYSQEELNAFRVARHALRTVDGSVLQHNVLYLTALAAQRPDLKITDLGGATGELGDDFLQAFPQATYTVVENPTLTRMMSTRSNSVRFTTELPESCDIFYSSSTLQYLDTPLAAFEAGLRSAKIAAVLVRNSFCKREIFRVQRSRLFANGGGPIPPGYQDRPILYPHRTIVEASVHECAAANGFSCVANLEEASGVVPHGDEVYGRQLVFMRNTTRSH